jgi:hypothetical protein
MSARPQEATEQPTLRVIDGGEAPPTPDSRQVVAEVLSDGSVRLVAGSQDAEGDQGYATGQVAGDGWTVWWDRRYWS